MSEQGSNQGGMIPGSDWSMGLNSPTSVSQATVLASLGGKLRNLYVDLIAEGVPQHLAEIVSRLDAGETSEREFGEDVTGSEEARRLIWIVAECSSWLVVGIQR